MAVATRGEHTYQASDLASNGRRSFIDEAKAGIARLRDTDGTSLVMLPEAELDLLSELRSHFLAYLSLENGMRRARTERRPTDFGELAWASSLAEDDLIEFREELRDELPRAITSRSTVSVGQLLRAWRLTAELEADTEAVSRVNSPLDEFEELARPEGSE